MDTHHEQESPIGRGGERDNVVVVQHAREKGVADRGAWPLRSGRGLGQVEGRPGHAGQRRNHMLGPASGLRDTEHGGRPRLERDRAAPHHGPLRLALKKRPQKGGT